VEVRTTLAFKLDAVDRERSALEQKEKEAGTQTVYWCVQ
jgi:hypothetical protein